MWGGKNLDLGSKPDGRRSDVSVKATAQSAPQSTPVSRSDLTVRARPVRRVADDTTRADVRVLARYSSTGLWKLVQTVLMVIIGLPVLGSILTVESTGEAGEGMFTGIIVLGLLALAVWVLRGVFKAFANIMQRGRQALYIEEGRLTYVSPRFGGSFALTADQITGLEYKPMIDRYGPAIILATTHPYFKQRRICVAALDVEPHPLAREIISFAGLTAQA